MSPTVYTRNWTREVFDSRKSLKRKEYLLNAEKSVKLILHNLALLLMPSLNQLTDRRVLLLIVPTKLRYWNPQSSNKGVFLSLIIDKPNLKFSKIGQKQLSKIKSAIRCCTYFSNDFQSSLFRGSKILRIYPYPEYLIGQGWKTITLSSWSTFHF